MEIEIALPILGKSAAGFIIEKLQTAVTSNLKEQYFWETNLETELKDLQDLLPQIQAVVDFAERDPITGSGCGSSEMASLEEWLWQFRDGIDEAEDMLDDLEYIRLEKKANADKTKLSKVVDASVRIAKRFLKQDDVAERLRTCMRNLSTMARGASELPTPVRRSSIEQYQHLPGEPITSSSLRSTFFHGRKQEKRMIIHTLTEESEFDTWNVRVLALVGMGGIGKTALAQQVYNQFFDETHFDIRIWVCVSTDFNVVSLTQNILECLTGVRCDYENLGILQMKIREIMQGKRFLLVLDDVWNDLRDWEILCAPLLDGPNGCWILLTTRSSSVVPMISSVMRCIIKEIEELSDDECRSLFYEYAFADEDSDAHPQLKSIGEEIIVKLKGIPLLAKTIGGVLSSKLDPEHWRRVLETDVWETPRDSRGPFIGAFRLSYCMLSGRLKRCFAYCMLFPQDYMFQKEELVNMWVAAGLIQPQQSDGLEEDIAMQCFDMLYTKSFFDDHPSIRKGYVMHHTLHSLACYVSRREYRRIIHDQLEFIPHTIRHLSITCTDTFDELPELTKMVRTLRYLRTLFIDYRGHGQKLYDFIQEACISPRSIRVLVIKFNGPMSSDKGWLTSFKNLRFLSLSECSISKISE